MQLLKDMRYLLVLITCFTAAILAFNFFALFSTKKEAPFLDLGWVRGSSIQVNNALYTLNFDQQTFILIAMNDAVILNKAPPLSPVVEFEKIVFYLFSDQSDLSLTPIGLNGLNLVFRSSDDKIYQEKTEGRLYALLLQTFDGPNA